MPSQRGKMGSLSPSLITRLIPAYGFGVLWLSVQPNRCTFVQSRAYGIRGTRIIESKHNRQCESSEIVFPTNQNAHLGDSKSAPTQVPKIFRAHTSDQTSEGGYNVGQTAEMEVPSVRAVNPRMESGSTDEKYSSTLPAVYREIQPRTMELV